MLDFRNPGGKEPVRTKRHSKRRKRLPFAKRVRKFFVNLANGILTVLVVGLLALIGWRIHTFLTSSYFSLKCFEITGASEDLCNTLKHDSGIKVDPSQNLLKISTSQLKKRILAHPRIRSMCIKKIYPSRLIVNVEERTPAVIVNTERMYLVDEEGYVMERLKGEKLKEVDLPFITGIDQKYIALGRRIDDMALFRALDLMMSLEENNPSLFKDLSEIHINERRALTAYFTGGTEVRFGTYSPVETLPSLEAFLSQVRNINSVQYVDLRFKKLAYYKPR